MEWEQFESSKVSDEYIKNLETMKNSIISTVQHLKSQKESLLKQMEEEKEKVTNG